MLRSVAKLVIFDNASVFANAKVYGNARVGGTTVLRGDDTVCGNAYDILCIADMHKISFT